MNESANTYSARVRILCREGEDFGAVCDQAGPFGDRRIETGEHRLHLFDLARLALEGAEVVSGPLEMPVTPYLTAIEGGALHRALFELPIGTGELPEAVLPPRARLQVVAIRRTAGKRGPITHLELIERGHPERRMLAPIDAVMLRLVKPPGATLTVAAGDGVLPVVLRLTTHLENLHENDLVTLPGCKGKWGRLEELG